MKEFFCIVAAVLLILAFGWLWIDRDHLVSHQIEQHHIFGRLTMAP
jgi:hypothetical protein